MAVTKIWTIKDSLQRVLDYAANPDQTEYDVLAQTLHYAENDAKTKLNESAQLVTGIHCRADHAWEDMRAVQERFGKTDGVVALHAYQSFREGEVTPEQCHEIGVALARKVWGNRFQVLVATHMNTDNLHNHFVINSVSYVDGKKSVEIAGMLNISQRTVEAQLYKGLKIIRNVLALLALVLFFR